MKSLLSGLRAVLFLLGKQKCARCERLESARSVFFHVPFFIDLWKEELTPGVREAGWGGSDLAAGRVLP